MAVVVLDSSTAKRYRAGCKTENARRYRLNSEFGNYVPVARQAPLVTLRPYGDPEYFPVGVKHRYTKK
jgi:phenylacetate-CoA ligase